MSDGRHPALGRTWPATTYAVGREKVREYALAVGERDPRHLDVAAARAAGYADVVAPPMFVVVYATPAIGPALFDPKVGIDFARMVHGGQSFRWHRLVVAGEELRTAASFAEHSVKGAMTFFTFVTTTTDADGAVVVEGRWTNIVRGG